MHVSLSGVRSTAWLGRHADGACGDCTCIYLQWHCQHTPQINGLHKIAASLHPASTVTKLQSHFCLQQRDAGGMHGGAKNNLYYDQEGHQGDYGKGSIGLEPMLAC